jgi:hypothetical protein
LLATWNHEKMMANYLFIIDKSGQTWGNISWYKNFDRSFDPKMCQFHQTPIFERSYILPFVFYPICIQPIVVVLVYSLQ